MAVTAISSFFLKGLDQPRERWCLAVCLLLCLFYAGIFAALDTASSRMDTRFLTERERFRLSRLLPLPLDKPVSVIEDGHVSRYFVLLSGWSDAESWGDWSDGPQAEFAIHAADTIPADPYLKIWVQVSAAPGGQQPIQLDAGTTRLGSWRLRPPSAILCMPLPARLATSSGVIRLRVGIGAPQRAASGLDRRALGLGLGGAAMLSGKEGCRPDGILPSG